MAPGTQKQWEICKGSSRGCLHWIASQSLLEMAFSNIVMNWDDNEWRRNFSIGNPTFHFPCTQLRSSFQCRDVVRRPLSVEERVAITLWRLGTNMEYRSISHLFGVGLSTVCVVVHEVCASIVNTLSSRYIRISYRWRHSNCCGCVFVFFFFFFFFLDTWGFLQCFGAIDSHIPIIGPSSDPLDYYNRKGFPFHRITSPQPSIQVYEHFR